MTIQARLSRETDSGVPHVRVCMHAMDVKVDNAFVNDLLLVKHRATKAWHASKHKWTWLNEVRCGVLQCVAICGGALQCVALCCTVLQCVAVQIWLGDASRSPPSGSPLFFASYMRMCVWRGGWEEGLDLRLVDRLTKSMSYNGMSRVTHVLVYVF